MVGDTIEVPVSGYEMLYLLFFDKRCSNCGATMDRYVSFDDDDGNNTPFYVFKCRGCGRSYKLSDLTKKQFKASRQRHNNL